jgi:hypothetical protein
MRLINDSSLVSSRSCSQVPVTFKQAPGGGGDKGGVNRQAYVQEVILETRRGLPLSKILRTDDFMCRDKGRIEKGKDHIQLGGGVQSAVQASSFCSNSRLVDLGKRAKR